MAKTPLIIANWKMNLPELGFIEYAKQISNYKTKNKLVIAPPSPLLAALSYQFSNIDFCAQDISIFDNYGSYTGEVSAAIMSFCKVKYAIIGHSERRRYFGENDLIANKKTANCLRNNITPIICIGEPLELRESGNFKDFLRDQLTSSIPDTLLPENQIIIAYEPLWSIGSGIIPSLNEIKEVGDLILNHEHLKLVAKNLRLVYGGSVSSKNHQDILSIENIDGLLVGSASLKYDEIRKILT